MTRDRGNYGPLDRDRHWAIGWATDQGVDYVRDRTVGEAARYVLPTASDVIRARRGAERVWNATRVIGGRAEAEKPAAQIGQELFHTVAARDRAMAQPATGLKALARGLAAWRTPHAEKPNA